MFAPMPQMNRVCLGCTHRASIAGASNVQKSQDDTKHPQTTFQEEIFGHEEAQEFVHLETDGVFEKRRLEGKSAPQHVCKWGWLFIFQLRFS